MNFSFSDWIGEVTTGHGAMILGPTLLAAASGTTSWSTAVPFLAAGVVGLLWPENAAMKSAMQSAATDVETLIAAYRTGMSHGAAGDAPNAAAAPSTPSAPAAPQPHSGAGATVSALAILVATGLAVTACANQTPAQQAATATAVASGLLCLADATGQVVTTAATSDSNSVKGVNAAIVAGSVLLTDTDCQTAFTSGTAALPLTRSMNP